jgi:hypothetical protein
MYRPLFGGSARLTIIKNIPRDAAVMAKIMLIG